MTGAMTLQKAPKNLTGSSRRRHVTSREETEKRFGIKLDEVKFDIVTHSMGGLVARYYVR